MQGAQTASEKQATSQRPHLVCITKCQLFRDATATKASMGCHYPQGTGPCLVIGVGKFACGLTFVACSRVCKLTDLLFNPPFPLQRIANLAKSQRLQERLHTNI